MVDNSGMWISHLNNIKNSLDGNPRFFDTFNKVPDIPSTVPRSSAVPKMSHLDNIKESLSGYPTFFENLNKVPEIPPRIEIKETVYRTPHLIGVENKNNIINIINDRLICNDTSPSYTSACGVCPNLKYAGSLRFCDKYNTIKL